VCLSRALPRSALVTDASDARFALLARLFDHAPLFPPASLPLPQALAEDERARRSGQAFALGRFVCPASQLAELPRSERALSLVLDGPLPAAARIAAVEARPGAELAPLAALAPEVYAEVEVDGVLEARLDAIASQGLRAKVRCGGASVPTSGGLARFLRGCRERGIAYKATAGLHHALRRDGAHGFLNLLAAAVFGDEEDALEETEPNAFALERDAFSWRGRRASAVEIARARNEGLFAIGSCSFFEPIEELEALGALPL
jgi:hypothetical protein